MGEVEASSEMASARVREGRMAFKRMCERSNGMSDSPLSTS